MNKKTKLQLEEELEGAYNEMYKLRQELLETRTSDANLNEVLKRVDEVRRTFKRVHKSFDGQLSFSHAERRGVERLIAGLIDDSLIDILSIPDPF